MKKIFAILTALFITQTAQALPDEVLELFDDNPMIADPDSDVYYKFHTLYINLDKTRITRKHAKQMIQLVCEDVYVSPLNWQFVRFTKIKVGARSGVTGYEMNVTPKECKEMMERDYYNSELDRHFFKDKVRLF